MAVGIEDQGRKFITTEPLDKSGESGQQVVWDAVRNVFADKTCIGYWRYPIFLKFGEVRKEPDILIVEPKQGIIIIEIKSIKIDQIVSIEGKDWVFTNFSLAQGNPYEQVENQLYALLGYCDREPAIRRKVGGKAILALPLITAEEWQQKGFDKIPNCPPIIFKNQLSKTSLFEIIEKAPFIVPGEPVDEQQWELLLAVLSGTPVLRQPPRLSISGTKKTRSSIIANLQDELSELDFQQEHIGKEIPPGFQRLRGIAGSGKTVLLCQKAANMHLKHPDWDIALVFFTRTLYDLIITLLDRWLRRFSNGDIQYDHETNKKLRVLHAWGAKEQPGLYSTICDSNGVRARNASNTSEKQPNRGLAELCKRLCEETEIEPIFDAILIDEGQDLVAEDELKYQDKQAIYWLAYQSLRPVDDQNPEQRRLIWAYDEAQSLDSLKIPTAKELFGENLSNLLSKGTQYTGGIKKSELMRRCYRTPGSILTAAHAIGMGLLRPEGMLTGITRADDWRAIGYEVKGKFVPGQKVTLSRPSKNSVNPIEQLWGEPVLEFKTYSSRQEELESLAAKIRHNLVEDDLKPSRDILVIVLGSAYDAIELENKVANFLSEQEIRIYIPTALELDELNPQWPNHDPDRFWMEGGITVSRVTRAKGNEANMVYVVGLDNVARYEDNVSLRNQLFVALTRAKGWACLSGVGNYPLYEEMKQVIESKDTFNFTYKRPLKRDIGEKEDIEK